MGGGGAGMGGETRAEVAKQRPVDLLQMSALSPRQLMFPSSQQKGTLAPDSTCELSSGVCSNHAAVCNVVGATLTPAAAPSPAVYEEVTKAMAEKVEAFFRGWGRG